MKAETHLVDRSSLTDLYFAEARAKLIDLAAFLDRIDRSRGQDDFRLKSLRAALAQLGVAGPDKTRQILLMLSDPTEEPVPEAGSKGAAGAWIGF